MSTEKKCKKSKGNVIYPKDLSERGFRNDQIRFFLIYGCYKEILNFTLEEFGMTSRKLDSFKNLIKELQRGHSTVYSLKEAWELIQSIQDVFEINMNNNLDAKSAFDKLYENICNLHKIKEKLSRKDLENIVQNLHKIDYVLQCIF